MVNPARAASSEVLPITDSVTWMTEKSSIPPSPIKDWARFAELRALTRQVARLITRQIVRVQIDAAATNTGGLAEVQAHNAAHEIVAELELLYAAAVSAEIDRLGAAEFRARVLSHFPEFAEELAEPQPEPDPYA